MELTLAAPPVHSVSPETVSARVVAERNLRLNLAALRLAQPGVEVSPLDLNWTFGRDGSVTVRDFGAWWCGYSLPAAAAAEQLRTLDVGGPLACFLDPPHGAHLRVALEKLQHSQAVVALVPDERALCIILGSEDLSGFIADHRLWFAYGTDWPQALRELYRERPGLATPAQFIRLNLPDPQRLDPLIATARDLIAEIVAARQTEARTVAGGWKPSRKTSRCCIVTGKHFRLWADSGLALAEIAGLAGEHAVPLCSDDPVSASTHALLLSAVECGALLTADIARADLPDLLPAELSWTTWVTTPRIPAAASAGPNDRLLLADPAWMERAVAAGWKKERVGVAGWPALLSPSPGTPGEGRGEGRSKDEGGRMEDEDRESSSSFILHPSSFLQSPHPNPLPEYRERGSCGKAPFVAAIADTTDLDPPARLEEFSSHRLLWNTIRDELLADPWLVAGEGDAYLTTRLRKFDVPEEGLDRQLFLRGLIEPAVTQGVARKLFAEGVPLRVFGRGWDELPEFSGMSGGAILSRPHLVEIAASAAAILDARPNPFRDQRHSLGRPVIRTSGRTALAVRQEIAQALKGQLASPAAVPPLELSTVLSSIVGEG